MDRGRAQPGAFHANVVGRNIFYNRSGFDGNNAAANAADDAAIATDKQALLPGGTATFANYTSYSRGINGIMVDVAGRGQSGGHRPRPTSRSRSATTTRPPIGAPRPRPRASPCGPAPARAAADRVTIVWADNAIQNQWLQVTVLAAGTGLAADDVFYFGNALGDSGAGNTPEFALVGPADETAVRSNKTGFAPTSITNVYDFNRDRRVTASDELTSRYLSTTRAHGLAVDDPGRRGGTSGGR